MKAGWGILVVLAGLLVACCLALPVAGAAPAIEQAGGCAVGGEPSLSEEERKSQLDGRSIGGAIVIACGRASGERIELVAAGARGQLCAWLERPRGDWESSATIFCKRDTDPWLGQCLPICALIVFQEGPIRGAKLRRTIAAGAVPLETALVRVMVGQDGRQRTFLPLHVRVTDPALLRRLHQSEPFFVFGTVLPRCHSARAVRVSTFDAAGIRTGAERGQELFSNPCRLPY